MDDQVLGSGSGFESENLQHLTAELADVVRTTAQLLLDPRYDNAELAELDVRARRIRGAIQDAATTEVSVTHASRRCWVIPPAMLNDPGTNMGEVGILGEHPPHAGMFLWNLARDVTLWANTPAHRRAFLFRTNVARRRSSELAAERAFPSDVVTWLDLLMELVYGSSRAGAPAGVLTDVSRRLVEWMTREGKAETALAFAQATALADPLDGRAAMLVGETAARFGRWERADSWFQRAVGIARRVKDWHTYTRSERRAGEVALRLRRYDQAEDRFKRAAHAARRKGYRREAAGALIGLLRVTTSAERYEEALEWEQKAARVVRHDAGRKTELAGASVELWMWQGDFDRALQGLDALWDGATTAGQRMYLLARIAHAAAGAGDLGRLGETWGAAWELAHGPSSASASERFRTFLELARAAERGGDPFRARRALQAAGAHANGEADAAALAEAGRTLGGLPAGRAKQVPAVVRDAFAQRYG